jgi:DNA polymerase-3 subunit alpha/error-prone DNA polymerase
VAKSGMMKEYIFRHNHPTQFEYFHKGFEEQLGETYGIMVYQEDVIKLHCILVVCLLPMVIFCVVP